MSQLLNLFKIRRNKLSPLRTGSYTNRVFPNPLTEELQIKDHVLFPQVGMYSVLWLNGAQILVRYLKKLPYPADQLDPGIPDRGENSYQYVRPKPDVFEVKEGRSITLFVGSSHYMVQIMQVLSRPAFLSSLPNDSVVAIGWELTPPSPRSDQQSENAPGRVSPSQPPRSMQSTISLPTTKLVPAVSQSAENTSGLKTPAQTPYMQTGQLPTPDFAPVRPKSPHRVPVPRYSGGPGQRFPIPETSVNPSFAPRRRRYSKDLPKLPARGSTSSSSSLSPRPSPAKVPNTKRNALRLPLITPPTAGESNSQGQQLASILETPSSRTPASGFPNLHRPPLRASPLGNETRHSQKTESVHSVDTAKLKLLNFKFPDTSENRSPPVSHGSLSNSRRSSSIAVPSTRTPNERKRYSDSGISRMSSASKSPPAMTSTILPPVIPVPKPIPEMVIWHRGYAVHDSPGATTKQIVNANLNAITRPSGLQSSQKENHASSSTNRNDYGSTTQRVFRRSCQVEVKKPNPITQAAHSRRCESWVGAF